MPFRPAPVTVYPEVREKFDRIERPAADGRQPASAIWKGLRTAVSRIQIDGQRGEVIPPTSIPRVYSRARRVTHLYCVDLPAFRRLYYTITNRDVIVIDLVDQSEHDCLMRR